MTTLLGLDIGGFKTRAVAARDGRVLQDVTVGTADLASVGAAGVRSTPDERAAHLDGTPVDAVCAGAAGAEAPETVAELGDRIADRFPRAVVRVLCARPVVGALRPASVGRPTVVL